MNLSTHSPSGNRDQQHHIKDRVSKNHSNICTDAPAHTGNTQRLNQGLTKNINVFACPQVAPQIQQIMKILTCSHKMINCSLNIPIKNDDWQPTCLTSAKRRALCACFILKRLIFCWILLSFSSCCSVAHSQWRYELTHKEQNEKPG